jgi:YVTN family beta-propeller protein
MLDALYRVALVKSGEQRRVVVMSPRRPPSAGPTGIAHDPQDYASGSYSAARRALWCNIPLGFFPYGVAVTPDGSKVYVANAVSNSVSVIATATNTVTATIGVGSEPLGVGVTSLSGVPFSVR